MRGSDFDFFLGIFVDDFAALIGDFVDKGGLNELAFVGEGAEGPGHFQRADAYGHAA